MSKAKINKTEVLPSNSEILNRYLGTFTFDQQAINSIKCAINKFFDLMNNKSMFTIETRDLSDFKNFLNQNSNFTYATKKKYLHEVKSFVADFLQYYNKHFDPNFLVLFLFFLQDHKNLKLASKHFHKDTERATDFAFDLKDIVRLLNYLKLKDLDKYLMFRILAEIGTRKGEMRSIDIERRVKGKIIKLEDDLNLRILRTIGKKGKKVYYISEELAKLLKFYLKSRLLRNVESKALFISSRETRIGITTLNNNLKGYEYKYKGETRRHKGYLELLGLDQSAYLHTFRKSLNTLRKLKGCPNEIAKILVNHKSGDVNIDDYTKYNYEQYLAFFDQYNPFKGISI